MANVMIRLATKVDLPEILTIYNQGIEDRIATLESDQKNTEYMQKWFREHEGRYVVMVLEMNHQVVGWASLNRYSHRCAYQGVAELSIYIHRDYRGKGLGYLLLQQLETQANQHQFHKIVLFTFPHNALGQGLYHKSGFRQVGIFEKQGVLDGKWIDVMAMEKILTYDV